MEERGEGEGKRRGEMKACYRDGVGGISVSVRGDKRRENKMYDQKKFNLW